MHTRLSWRHQGHVLVLVDDGPGDVGVQDVEAEGEDAELNQAVVAFGFLGRPPANDAQRDVEHGGQALNAKEKNRIFILIMYLLFT